jgi:cytochrome c biogenesis protein CcmG/thiol:disulfide interchange protein DsbE
MRMLVAALAAALSLPAFGLAVGDAAPPFALATAAGETIGLERLRGNVVYVDFWASWCGPCKRSFPWMNALQRKYGAKGLAIVAVNVDKKRPDAERFLAQTPAEFTIVYDAAGATPAAWGVKGMPSSYLLDSAGRVVAVEQGFRDDGAAALDAQIGALLTGK